MSGGALDDVVAHYLGLRAKVKEIEAAAKEQVAPIKAAMAQIETAILGKFARDGVRNAATPHGTPYIHTAFSATVADPGSFKEWVMRAPQVGIEYMEIRASKDAIKALCEAGNPPPPGINVATVEQLRIREGNK